MNCNIIKDLLPSYIDGICSEDTIKLVEEHLSHCEKCNFSLKMMQQQTDYKPKIPEETKKAIAPFKKINKKRHIQVTLAILMTLILTIVGGLIVQDVDAVNQIFFPKTSAIVVIDSTADMENWEKINFITDELGLYTKDYLIYDSIFWKKEIINDANSEDEILIRVKDAEGEIVVDELLVSPGTGVQLKELKKNEKYYIEVKAEQKGRYFINAV